MRTEVIFSFVGLGAIAALSSAYMHSGVAAPVAPVFNPAPNPYSNGIYANGIIESYQASGQNTSIYPEVAASVVRVLVAEGQEVQRGTPLVQLDDSVQRANVEQQRAQSEAAQAMLAELRAQPRKENLEVAKAQVNLAQATLKSASDQLDKQARSRSIVPESVSQDAYDNAFNAKKVAEANLGVLDRQYDLARAGAWSFDIAYQIKQAEALSKAYASGSALLAKYTVLAPVDGVVLSIGATVGSYVSPQGAYDLYTGGMAPLVVMGAAQKFLSVRCYVDEVLIPRLPPQEQISAKMFVRGTDVQVPLDFVRIQPFVAPKIQLSNQRQEKVDVRVLPIVFRFEPPPSVGVYPGQLVDVYIGSK